MADITPVGFPVVPGDVYDRAQTAGTIASAIAYGMVIVLFLNCFKLLLTTKYIYSKRTRLFLSFYMVCMFSFSTLAIVQSILYNKSAIFCSLAGTFETTSRFTFTFTLNIPLSIPFTIWGADGFMLWRCLVLYQGISGLQRIAFLLLLSLLAIISLGSGVIFFLTDQIAVPILPPYPENNHPSLLTSLQGPSSLTISITPFVNIVIAALIVGRVLHHQRRVRKFMGHQYGSPYTKIMTMCVESCAMIIVSGVIYIGLYYGDDRNGQNLEILTVMLIFPHICVISPFLIIYRVAIGRAACSLATSGTNVQMATSDFNLPRPDSIIQVTRSGSEKGMCKPAIFTTGEGQSSKQYY